MKMEKITKDVEDQKLTEGEERLRKAMMEFMNPKFSTTDFEEAMTRCRNKFHITSMEEFSERSYPEKVNGYVEFSCHGILKVWWDRYGKCHLAATGTEKREYDLIRKENKEIQSGKIIAGAIMFIIVTLAITLIFRS